MQTAIDTLVTKMRELRNPSVIGLDTHIDHIPDDILRQYGSDDSALGLTQAILAFNKAVIDAVYDIVPAVKPQIAFYEKYGAAGIDAYIQTVLYAKYKHLIVIGDVKRGDIASTSDAYADGHLGRIKVGSALLPVFNEDFITLNPYMGSDSIEPFFERCKTYGKGIFILVKTSNPGSGQIQDLRLADRNGAFLYEEVARLVSEWGAFLNGECGYSAVGAVVGATHPVQARRLRELMPHTLFLAPGYGAQGAKVSDLVDGSLVNSSRKILCAWKTPPYCKQFSPQEFALASRAAALDMKEELSCLKI